MIKKALSLLMLFNSVSYAQSCNSVALWSVSKKLNKVSPVISYDKECEIFEISSQITQRCGCFDSISEAKELLKKYIDKFPTAYITPTLKSRFDTKAKQSTVHIKKTPEKKQIISKPIIVQKEQKSKFVSKKFTLKTLQVEDNNSIKTALMNNKKLMNNYIKNESDFYGLSLYGNYGQYFNQDYLDRKYTDFESKIQLKFELFKNGYFEHKKDKNFRVKQLEFNYFKDLSLVQNGRFLDTLLILEELNNKINTHYYTQLANLYSNIIDIKQKALKNSLITSYDFDLLEHSKARYTRMALIYTKKESINFSDKFYKIFQNVEYIQLIDLDKIISYTKKYNPDLNLQKAQISLLDTELSYTDRVKMNLYVNYREVDELGTYNTLGIEANLPIDFSTQELSKYTKLQKNSKKITIKSLENSIVAKIKKAYVEFGNLQNFIDLDKDEIYFFNQRIKKFEVIKKNTIPNLNFDPDEKILLNQKKILDLKYDILLKRMKLYKILNEITYISNMSDIKNIIKEKI